MFNELYFCRDEGATAQTVEQLCQSLAAELGSPHTVAIRDNGTSIELVEFGIKVTFVFKGDDCPIVAVVSLPRGVDVGHVAQLCLAFQTFGWVC